MENLDQLEQDNQQLREENKNLVHTIENLISKIVRLEQLKEERKERDDKEEAQNQDIEVQDRSLIKAANPVIYEKSHVLQEMMEDSPPVEENKEDKPVMKNWTDENEKTVRGWQIDIEKTSFIYNEVLLIWTFRMHFILITVLILTSLCAIFSALSVTLTFLNIKGASITFEIMILICTGGSAVLTGILKLFHIDETILTLARFIEKLDNSWFVFEIELGIPPDQRTDAREFIRRADGQYLSLMQHCPLINPKEYSRANKRYHERLYDNYLWASKFRKKIRDDKEKKIDEIL